MNCKLLPVVFLAASVPFAPRAVAQEVKEVMHAAPDVKAPPQPVVRPNSGNAWFPVTDQDLGTHFSQDTVVANFRFKNPRDKAVVWKTLLGSCQCSKADITVADRHYRYTTKPTQTITRITKGQNGDQEEKVSQIEVGAGEEGNVEVQMELGGQSGVRNATLTIHTTDEQLPQLNLKWNAVGAQVFVLSPQDVNLNQMVWNDKREFTVTVQSPLRKDFNITGYDDTDKDFKVTYEKALANDLATWTIKGTYAPRSADVVGGGVLKFTTDVPGQPALTVRVTAAIQGPLEVKPASFLTLGMIRRGNTRTERVTFEPNDGTDLDAIEVRFERTTMDSKFLTTHKSKDGKKLIIEIEVSKDAPVGLLRGDLVVELNHPAVKTKKILFNGFVR